MSELTQKEWLAKTEQHLKCYEALEDSSPESLLHLFYAVEAAAKSQGVLADYDPKQDIGHKVLATEKEEIKNMKETFGNHHENLKNSDIPGETVTRELHESLSVARQKVKHPPQLQVHQQSLEELKLLLNSGEFSTKKIQDAVQEVEVDVEVLFEEGAAFISEVLPLISEEAVKDLEKLLKQAEEKLSEEDITLIENNLSNIVELLIPVCISLTTLMPVKVAFSRCAQYNEDLHTRLRYHDPEALKDDEQISLLLENDQIIAEALETHNKALRSLLNQLNEDILNSNGTNSSQSSTE